MMSGEDTNRIWQNVSRMVGFFLMFLGVLVLLRGPIQPYVSAYSSTHGIHIPSSSHKYIVLNNVKERGGGQHSFTLYNGRSYSQRVYADADCGCTGLSWTQTSIPPFGKRTISAHTSDKNSNSSVGITFALENHQFIFVTLNHKGIFVKE